MSNKEKNNFSCLEMQKQVIHIIKTNNIFYYCDLLDTLEKQNLEHLYTFVAEQVLFFESYLVSRSRKFKS